MAVVAFFVVFSLLYIAPGDPAAVIAGEQASPADVERIRQNLGLDQPFMVRFGEWVWQILHGDLGTSIFTNLPVTTMIEQRFEPTLSLMAITLILSVGVAGAARRRRRLEGGHLGRPRRHGGFGGVRLLGAGVRGRLSGLAYVFAALTQFEWLPVQGYRPIADGICGRGCAISSCPRSRSAASISR